MDLPSLNLGTGGLSIYASEMARAALTTLIENSMPTSSAQAPTVPLAGGESTTAATHLHQCNQETSVQEEPTDPTPLVETTMEDG